MACCAMGPCDDSVERGGSGCDLCDRVAHLPQAKATDATVKKPRRKKE